MKNLSLLLIEDSPTDAHMALRILKKAKPETQHHWIEDGEEAVSYFQNEESELPKMILLDLRLPKVNGFGVLKEIRANERFARLPVIVYSSSGQEEDIQEAIDYGANSYLVKPGNYGDMKELLGLTFRYWIESNQSV